MEGDLALPAGYELVQSCKIVIYKIIGTVNIDGVDVPRVMENTSGAWYLVGQSFQFMRGFQEALIASRDAIPDGFLANPVCQEIIACTARACGY